MATTYLEHRNFLPRRTKVGYGVAHMGIFAVEIFIRYYLLKFYTDVVGLRADIAGYAVALAVIWDAFTDPIMGNLSDKTNSRWGKRRPYIFVGGIALAIATMTLFSPKVSAIDTQFGKFLFLLGSYIFLNTCLTIIVVPYYALGGELTEDTVERTEVYGWLVVFGNIGSIIGVVLPGEVLAALTATKNPAVQAKGYMEASGYMALILVACVMVTFYSSRGRDHCRSSNTFKGIKTFFLSMGSAFKNPVFIPLFFMYMVGTIGLTINSATALYYYEYRLLLNKQQINIIFSVFLVTWSVSIIMWIKLSAKYGKKWPAFWGGFSLGVLVTIFYPILPPGYVSPPILVGFFGGIMAGAVVLLYSLLTDIVDYDEIKTGLNREGLYFGLWNLGTKVARAIAFAIAGNVLWYIEFKPNQSQTEEVAQALAWIFGPGVGFFMIVSALIFLWMPVTLEKQAQIQRIIKWRRKKEEEKKFGHWKKKKKKKKKIDVEPRPSPSKKKKKRQKKKRGKKNK